MTEHPWVRSGLLPFVRYPRADFLTVLLFVTLGPLSGSILFGLQKSGLQGALGAPFVLAFVMGLKPNGMGALAVLVGALPAYAAGLTALAVRGLDRLWIFVLGAVIGDCGTQICLLSTVKLDNRAGLVLAGVGAAAICAVVTYRARRALSR